MSGSTSLNDSVPSLVGDFSLISVQERTEWRDALARHIVQCMKLPDGRSLPEWKIEEQIASVNSAVASLIAQGYQDPQAIIQYFIQENFAGTHYAISE